MGLPALHADYLFAAPLIKARLEEQVPDTPVEVCETVEQLLAADRRECVVMVMWAGERFGAGVATHQQVSQRWLVILALNNVGLLPDARQVRAGPMLSRLHRALAGWKPEGAVRSFERAQADMRPDIRPQKALYPLGFELSLNL